jgi:hypothetical protein
MTQSRLQQAGAPEQAPALGAEHYSANIWALARWWLGDLLIVYLCYAMLLLAAAPALLTAGVSLRFFALTGKSKRKDLVRFVFESASSISNFANAPLFIAPRQAKTQDLLRKTFFSTKKRSRCFLCFFSPFSTGRCAEPVRAF